MTQLTEQDHANSTRHQAVADNFRREFEDAKVLVWSVLGRGGVQMSGTTCSATIRMPAQR
jgi:hypothetical protein